MARNAKGNGTSPQPPSADDHDVPANRRSPAPLQDPTEPPNSYRALRNFALALARAMARRDWEVSVNRSESDEEKLDVR